MLFGSWWLNDYLSFTVVLRYTLRSHNVKPEVRDGENEAVAPAGDAGAGIFRCYFAPPFVRMASAAAALISISVATGPVYTSVRVIGTINSSSAFQIRWDGAPAPPGPC